MMLHPWRFLLFTATVTTVSGGPWRRAAFFHRGGATELTLEEKVHAAMQKLGLEAAPERPDCQDGVCKSPVLTKAASSGNDSVMESNTSPSTLDIEETVDANSVGIQVKQDTVEAPTRKNTAQVAASMAKELGVDESLAWAALGATSTSDGSTDDRIYHEDAARDMILSELEMIQRVPEESAAVQQLASEGYGGDIFLIRRALAFADGNLDDARAILQAEMDEMDEVEEEEENRQQKEIGSGFQTVTVDANFDPTAMEDTTTATQPKQSSETPTPAPRDEVIFEATTDQVFELVLQSPVPVLLDIYADWCGPCKTLSPILEDMAIKSGGAFRLVKVNSDTEKPIAGTALQVSALPTIFGVRDGKILNSFQGMPKSEDMMRNFMMGLLIPGQAFDPPVSAADAKNYATLTNQLIKISSAAAYPFSARERLQVRVSDRLDDLVKETGDNVLSAESSANIMRTLLNNLIKDPFATKYRHINLANKVLASKVSQYPACMAILKSVGFAMRGKDAMELGDGQKIVNLSPLSIARDAIDKWVSNKKYELAKANRQAKDEKDRVLVQQELARRQAEEEEDDEEEEEDVDENLSILKVRVHGKKKIYNVEVHADEPVREILQRISGLGDDGDFQIICAAKRLVIRSEDDDAMKKTLRSSGLWPTANLVVKQNNAASSTDSVSKLADRQQQQRKKRGSHTMQSVGIYGKDDNAKGELIDGGGGVLYEQDVTDDEEDERPKKDEADESTSDEVEVEE